MLNLPFCSIFDLCKISIYFDQAFIYKEGFARVSTQKYSLHESDTGNLFIHLTNSSIQKHNEQGPSADNPLARSGADAGGSKISLGGENGLWQRLRKYGRDPDNIWKDICLLVVKSVRYSLKFI